MARVVRRQGASGLDAADREVAALDVLIAEAEDLDPVLSAVAV